MDEKGTSLIKSEDSIFKKISNWFKNLFGKKNNDSPKEELIENSSENNIEVQESSDSQTSNDFSEFVFNFDNCEEILSEISEDIEEEPKKDTKKKFFELYSDIKDGIVDIKDLSLEDLKKFNIMVQEEISIRQEKLEDIKIQNEKLEQEIADLNSEVKKLNY